MDLTNVLGDNAALVDAFNKDGIPIALLVILCAITLVRFSNQSLNTLGERITERRLLFKQVSVITRFFIIFITCWLVIDSVFTFSAEAVYVSIGLLVLALGYALKDLFASVVAGLILMFDRPFHVGDRINFANHYGEVKEIGLRAVRIVDLGDNLISIPNSRFLSESVSSANFGGLDQMCEFRFYIGCQEDFERAQQIIYEAAASSRYVFLGKPIKVMMREGPVPDGAERFAIEFKVKAYVFDGRYEQQFETDVHIRVKRAFKRRGIRTAGEIEWSLDEPDTESHKPEA